METPNAAATPRTPLLSWSTLGPWYQGPGAPNGSTFGRRERRVTTYRLYNADFYGTGERTYLDFTATLQVEARPAWVESTWVNSGSDGDPDRIAAVLLRDVAPAAERAGHR